MTFRNFDFFPKSFVVIPIRNLVGYVAAEKQELLDRVLEQEDQNHYHQFYEKFRNFSINSIIRSWLISLQELIKKNWS